MNKKDILELLIECIEQSKNTIKVCVPSEDYYRRADEWVEDRIQIINPEWLIGTLKDRLEEIE